MSDNVTHLNAKQEKALAALLSSPSIREASALAGLSERQVHRYLADPAFAAEYQAARDEAFKRGLSSLQIGAQSAAAVMRRIVEDEANSPALRLGAAAKLISLAIKAREIQNVEARLDDMERRLEEAKL